MKVTELPEKFAALEKRVKELELQVEQQEQQIRRIDELFMAKIKASSYIDSRYFDINTGDVLTVDS